MVYNKYSLEKESEIIKMYNDGYSQKDIANMFNTYNTTIRRILIRNNITLRNNKEIQRKVIFSNLNLNSREFDYYLGLFIADGNIFKNRFTIGFKEEDRYMLESISKFLGGAVNINTYLKKGTSFKFSELKFRSEEFCDYLKTKAVFENKYTKSELYCELNSDILRGLFDGDGCIHIPSTGIPNITIASKSNKILLQIQSYLGKLGIKSNINFNKAGVGYVTLVNKTNTVSFLKHIYQDTNLFLIRKKLLATPYLIGKD